MKKGQSFFLFLHFLPGCDKMNQINCFGDDMDLPGKIKGLGRHRALLLMLADFLLLTISYMLSWLILLRRIIFSDYLFVMGVSYACFIAIFYVSFWLFGMYQSLWRYAEAHEFFNCMLATLAATAAFVTVTWAALRPPFAHRIPITVYFLSAMLAGGSTLFLRMGYRAYRTTKTGRKLSAGAKKVMVVGAGETGNAVIQDLHRDPGRRYDVVCAVDDNPAKRGRRIQRVRVEGMSKDIPKLAETRGVDIIILAIPSASNKEKRRISNICSKTKCQLKKVPDLTDFVTGSIISQMQDVSVEDLLGRDVIDIGGAKSKYLQGKTVLVTGAGGSIGAELCRQVSARGVGRLVLLDISENGLYDIQQELLRKHGGKLEMHAQVASVRDERKLDLLFAHYKPDIVYHAAAHKHVPLMETAPEEAVKNNIFGTLNTARCADKHGVKRFVMISTDKAVNPTNVMGATKRVCEMIIQSMNAKSKTEFVAVRFGNVLGSNGSVIPLFKAQIAAGGPVTVTHKEIVRYFMTIPEAVSLVMTAGEMAKGGEIFVLDMGEPVKIVDLAETLIRMSGYEPYRDIDISITGLRPGEKLYEELLMSEEGLKKTSNNKIFIGAPLDIQPQRLFDFLDELKPLAERNEASELIARLRGVVPGFIQLDGHII
jgi:FlaA1/EpsC-like NDP-sugar epimerase